MFYLPPVVGSYQHQDSGWRVRIMVESDTAIESVTIKPISSPHEESIELLNKIEKQCSSYPFGSSFIHILTLQQLQPNVHYRVQITDQNQAMETCEVIVPEGRKTRYYVISCDGYGTYASYKYTEEQYYRQLGIQTKNKKTMWQRLIEDAEQATKEGYFCQFLHIGDQVYVDRAVGMAIDQFGNKSLSEKEKQTVTELIQKEYRSTWNKKYTKDCLKKFSHLMILDDHEVIDDWKSLKVNWHGKAISDDITSICLEAYKLYQHSLYVPPEYVSLDFRWTYIMDNTQIISLDLRSHRESVDPSLFSKGHHEEGDFPLLGEEQFTWFVQQLQGPYQDIMVVLTTAIVHSGVYQATLSKATSTPLCDSWSASEKRIKERNKVLEAVFAARKSGKRVMCLSGDSHKSGFYMLEDHHSNVPYIVSSPISSLPAMSEVTTSKWSCFNMCMCYSFTKVDELTEQCHFDVCRMTLSNTIFDYCYAVIDPGKQNTLEKSKAVLHSYLGEKKEYTLF